MVVKGDFSGHRRHFAYRGRRPGNLAGADGVHQLLSVLLVIGVPLIALPIGTLLGQLMGFGRLNHIMKRHGIGLAGISTPQAREALRALARVRTFAVIAPLIMCYWFAGWWIAWSLGVGSEYASLWKTQFLILWLVSIALYIFAGILPAHSFRMWVAELSGEQRDARRARNKSSKPKRFAAVAADICRTVTPSTPADRRA